MIGAIGTEIYICFLNIFFIFYIQNIYIINKNKEKVSTVRSMRTERGLRKSPVQSSKTTPGENPMAEEERTPTFETAPVWGESQTEETQPQEEPNRVRVYIGSNFATADLVDEFEEQVTASDIIEIARDKGIRRFSVYKKTETGREALSANNFPIDPPAELLIEPLDKVG